MAKMATIKDIANKAGVSMMTVSRAFNNPDAVKDEVRSNIMSIAKELGYVPNQAARSLANKKTGIIQIVTSIPSDDFYFTQLFTGAAQYLSKNGLSIMISYKKKGDYQHDGVIYMGLEEGEDRKLYHTEKKPFVLFGKSDLPIDWVDINNVGGMYTVTKYLIDNGHRSIGFVGIDQNEAFTNERYKGFTDAMRDESLTVNDRCVFFVENSIEGVKAVGRKLMANDMTAFVCESDVLAYGLIDYCRENGISVPDDLSIVGFDGFLMNKLSNPPITTVVQPVYEIGEKLGEVLMNRLNDPEAPKQELVIDTSFEPGCSVRRLSRQK